MKQIIVDLKHHFYHGSMITKLIFANGIVFIGLALLKLICWMFGASDIFQLVFKFVALPMQGSELLVKPWTMFTHMFVHSHTGIFHIIFNMYILFFFGQIFYTYLNEKKVLPVYLLGGLFAASFTLIAYNILPVFKDATGIMYGASASVMAIVFAAITIAPQHQLHLMFIGSVRILYIGLFLLFIDLISIPNSNAGGHIAHLFGALFGFVYIKLLEQGNDLAKPVNRFLDFIVDATKGRKKGPRVAYKSTTQASAKQEKRNNQDVQRAIDDILDKISESGYDSLSKAEKKLLFDQREKE